MGIDRGSPHIDDTNVLLLARWCPGNGSLNATTRDTITDCGPIMSASRMCGCGVRVRLSLIGSEDGSTPCNGPELRGIVDG